MENNNILKSFDLQKELNKKVWKKTSSGSYVIQPNVREKLLEIAYEFIQFLKVDIIVSDVHLTGSLANYNWSEYSDFDLHIIADFNQFPKNKLDLYKELFTLKKTIFNSEQNIKIYSYDVELYVQDENEEHTSTGVYSLISNDWLEQPKKEKFELNKDVLKKKIEQWTNKIDKVIDSAEEEKDLQKSKKIVDNLKDKIKQYRKIGLEKGGEMSYENLVFKYLRRSGHIEKLFDFKKKKLDKELSIQEQEEKGIKGFFEKLFGSKNKEEKKVDNPKKADLVAPNKEEIVKNLDDIEEPVKQDKKGAIDFQKNVESIQMALVSLGYELPIHGVDGLYGPETAEAIRKFKIDNNIKETKRPLEVLFESKLNEANTYGFPEGNVDSGKVFPGGEGGNWGGSMDKALEILSIARDCKGGDRVVSSQKRSRVKTASGRVSDHYVGNLGAYAVDIPCRGKEGDDLLACIMEKWNGGSHSDYKGGKWLNVNLGGYRYQFGWRVKNHYDHIHVGVKRDGSKVVDVDSQGEVKSDKETLSGDIITPSTIKILIDKLKGLAILPSKLEKLSDVEKKTTEIETSSELPQSVENAISSLEKNFNLVVTKENIQNEIKQEGVSFYEDAGGVNPEAHSSLSTLLYNLYKSFPNAPKNTNQNCKNLLGCVSGYRGYNTQISTFGNKVKNGDVSQRQKVSALPGFSQHHTGKAFDILSVEDSFWNKNPQIEEWVEKNAPKYGFRVSYPTQGVLRKREPWHLYYTK